MKKIKIDPEKRDKAIDGTISVLKIAGQSDLFLGIFLILEGLALAIKPAFFPIFIVLSILIAYAFAFEWFFKVIRHERTVWNVIQRIFIIIIAVALLVYCGFMIFDEVFRVNVDRVLVCATTIADGIKNLVHTLKLEKRRVPRIVFGCFSVACIGYGIAYGILGGAEANIFTTTMHGIIFVFCGLTNIWLYIFDPERKKGGKRGSERGSGGKQVEAGA